MPMFTSRNILAKDIIGWAQELVAVEKARLALDTIGRTYYNMAIAEIHNILGYIDVESLMIKQSLTLATPTGQYYSVSLLTAGASTQTSGTLTVGMRYRINTYNASDNFLNVGASSNASGVEFTAIGTTPTTWTASSILQQIPLYNYDKIVALEVINSTSQLQAFPLPINEFLRHKSGSTTFTGALHPYEEAVVYTINDYFLHLLFGKSITLASPSAYIYFTRQPAILNSSNYSTQYMDIPDKYAPLLANRIAAYAEMREGISDKAMAVVQSSYSQLLSSLDPMMKAKIYDSFQFKPVFTPNEQRD